MSVTLRDALSPGAPHAGTSGDSAGAQRRLLLETLQDALNELVIELGGHKHVGHVFRPEMSPEDAGNWLRKAIKGDRREALRPLQLLKPLRMGRDIGCHTAMQWIDEHLSYEPPVPITRESEIERLAQIIANAAEKVNAASAQLARIRPFR
jgi:hypothetical protein